MSFYKKYELIDVLRDDGVKTFHAKEIESGRMVEVHLFVGVPGKSDPPYGLLEAIRSIPSDRRAHLVESGEHMGTPYVVTLPLSGTSLHDWVQANKVEPAQGSPETLARVGRWKIPPSIREGAAPPEPAPAVTKRENIPQPDVPDITRMFRTAEIVVPPKQEEAKPWSATGQMPAVTPSMPPAAHDDFDVLFQSGTASRPAPPPPAATQPGDFTQMFQTGNLKASAPPPLPPPAAPASKPGEFTSLFQAPAAAPPAVPQPDEFNRMFDTVTGRIKPDLSKAPPPATGGGEFTQMFQAPAAPAKTDLPKTVQAKEKAPAAGAPGEFTQMFHAPAAAPPAPAPKAAEVSRTSQMPAFNAPADPKPAGPSEFTQMFQASTGQMKPPDFPAPAPPVSAPAAAPSPAAPPASGEFTQMFQAPMGQAKPSEPTRTAQIPAFPAPAAAAAPAAPSPAPGDFTQMFQATSGPVKAPAAPAPPTPSTGEFTQMFQTHSGPAAAPPPPPSSGAAGEFTQMFQTAPHQPFGEAPMKPTTQRGTPPGVQPPSPPAPQAPGEFTRMFASPSQPMGGSPTGFSAPPPPAAPSTPQEPGEFTRIFSKPNVGSLPKQQLPVAAPQQSPVAGPNPFAPPTSPLPPPMVPPNPGQGASPFAQQGFGAPPPGQPSSPFCQQPPAQQGFGAIPQRPYAAPAQPSVQDEYAKLFGGGAPSGGGFSAPPPPPAPQQFQGGGFSGATQSFQAPQMPMQAGPAAGPSEYTRMFSAPKDLQAPAAPPAVPTPVPIAAAKKSPKWPLFVAGGIFLLLLIGLIVTLIRK